jgi:hypothetical protein
MICNNRNGPCKHISGTILKVADEMEAAGTICTWTTGLGAIKLNQKFSDGMSVFVVISCVSRQHRR